MYHSIHIKHHIIQSHKETLPTMQQPLSFLYHRQYIYLTRLVSHMKQEILNLHRHLGSFIDFLVFGKVCIAHRFSFLYCCCLLMFSQFCVWCPLSAVFSILIFHFGFLQRFSLDRYLFRWTISFGGIIHPVVRESALTRLIRYVLIIEIYIP